MEHDGYRPVQISTRLGIRSDHPGTAVKRFGYLRDPLFLACCALYVVNRWFVKPYTQVAFYRDWCDDLLLIPCALPPLLLMHRSLKLRVHDAPPTLIEIAVHLIAWSILFEWIGPHLMARATGDLADIAAYGVGALFAALWWQRERFERNPAPQG
jgi:hypothetical protein